MNQTLILPPSLPPTLPPQPRKWETQTIQLPPEDGDGEDEGGREGEGAREKQVERCVELQLILKWGGDLTKLGERQAERLGKRFTQVGREGGRQGERDREGGREGGREERRYKYVPADVHVD